MRKRKKEVHLQNYFVPALPRNSVLHTNQEERRMRIKTLYAFIGILVVASMALAACQPAAPTTPEPAAPAEPAPVEPAAPAEPAPAEPAEPAAPAEPVEPAMDFEPMVVTNATCGEGDIVKEIVAVDEFTVRFTLCKPDPAFIAKAAFEPFAIQPREYIEAQGGAGLLLEAPIGTGPYKLERWERGSQLVFSRFDDYWGTPALSETAVIRWSTESAARLLELQSGTVHIISNLAADDFEVVENDPNLQLIPQLNPNTLYLGFTNTFEPFDNPDVRRAIAMGIDRQRIVDFFLPDGSEAADYFTPCTVPNGCDGDPWYEFDPEAARQMLADAGYPDGFDTIIAYRDVFRGYLPAPSLVAVEIQTQLRDNLGINAEVVLMESGEFIDESTSGRIDGMYLLGWGADYLHVTNFLDFHFGRNVIQFGDSFPEIYEKLEEAATLVDPGELYAEANNAIRDLAPMVPISHAAVGYAALADLEGAHVPPFGAPELAFMQPADGGPVVYMQNAEPISLYCMDESDGESLAGCRQITEGLLIYNRDGEAELALAESYDAADDATEYIFYLRQGVLFHDGSSLDANDVVASWAAGLDASSPYHVGNTGSFDYPAYLLGLMND
jgi:peptide/nickel transport system substrate-binding protein